MKTKVIITVGTIIISRNLWPKHEVKTNDTLKYLVNNLVKTEFMCSLSIRTKIRIYIGLLHEGSVENIVFKS